MAIDYIKLANVAKRLIDENGRDTIFIVFNQTLADPTKPWNGPADPRDDAQTSVTLKAAFIPRTDVSDFPIITIDEDLLKRVDKVCMVAPGSSFTIDLSKTHEVVDEGIRYRPLFIETFKPALTTLLYFMGIKR